MQYKMTMEDLNGLASYIGAETKLKGDELKFKYCPYCGNSTPRDDEWKFGVNINTGAFGCFRSSCHKQGHFVELARDVGYSLNFDNDTEYKRLPQPKAQIIPRDSAVEYLKGRGISEATARKYEITAYEKEPWKMFIPFFNEYGKLECIKYRNMKYKKGRDKSKEWFEEGCKPILFGMKQCENFDTLIITEGQMDSLSVAEAGIKNACSVPNGANGFSWIANCWDWIVKFDRIIVFGDMEKGHMSLLDTIVQRLPNRIFAVQKQDYMGEKDANAILTAFGKDAVRHCIENAKETEIDFVIDLADVRRKKENDEDKIKTGIIELDEVLKGGLRPGQLFLLTGKSGEGKSTFASQIMVEALEQNIHVFAYSGELDNEEFQECIDYQIAGDTVLTETKNEFGKAEYVLDEDTEDRIREWYRGKAFIYDNNRITKNDRPKIPDIVRKVIVRRDVKLVLIDNLMTAMEYIRNQNDLHLAQSHFVMEMKDIAQQYHVTVILIAHPRKQATGTKDKFINDDISGSADIGNQADIIASYTRAEAQEDYNSILQVTKNRKTGKLRKDDDAIHLNYSVKSRRITGERCLAKHYGWEQMGTDVTDQIDVPF